MGPVKPVPWAVAAGVGLGRTLDRRHWASAELLFLLVGRSTTANAAIRVEPLTRIPCHGHRAYALEANARIVRLHERNQSPARQQESPRRRLDAVENRLRELALGAREDIVS